MVNKNYANGRAREYRTLREFEKKGCQIVFRSAGSHSKIDCVGIDMVNKKIYFVQCKPKSLSDNKKNLILEDLKKLNDKFICSIEVR